MKFLLHTNYQFGSAARFFTWPRAWGEDAERVNDDSVCFGIVLGI